MSNVLQFTSQSNSPLSHCSSFHVNNFPYSRYNRREISTTFDVFWQKLEAVFVPPSDWKGFWWKLPDTTCPFNFYIFDTQHGFQDISEKIPHSRAYFHCFIFPSLERSSEDKILSPIKGKIGFVQTKNWFIFNQWTDYIYPPPAKKRTAALWMGPIQSKIKESLNRCLQISSLEQNQRTSSNMRQICSGLCGSQMIPSKYKLSLDLWRKAISISCKTLPRQLQYISAEK